MEAAGAVSVGTYACVTPRGVGSGWGCRNYDKPVEASKFDIGSGNSGQQRGKQTNEILDVSVV